MKAMEHRQKSYQTKLEKKIRFLLNHQKNKRSIRLYTAVGQEKAEEKDGDQLFPLGTGFHFRSFDLN